MCNFQASCLFFIAIISDFITLHLSDFDIKLLLYKSWHSLHDILYPIVCRYLISSLAIAHEILISHSRRMFINTCSQIKRLMIYKSRAIYGRDH